MPPYIKGGVWSNAEDEVLKSAVAKYGLNQWARVSSLLNRKTAKQAKARWNEWLDPTINKSEWSEDEDRKLLYLAKIFPAQWRSIAPRLGRTATQCDERYQKLLDNAQRRERAIEGIPNEAHGDASGPSSFTVGEIDPRPETRPAKPDPVDMDEDVLEMLSEARARLANTKGKKAKRKDRERLLAETNRLALLQKRRELKQAGITTFLGKRNKSGMDYNRDIPFEHKPAPGVYDVSEEAEQNFKATSQFETLMLSKGIYKPDAENGQPGPSRKRKEVDEKDTLNKDREEIARTLKLQEIHQKDAMAKRRKLELPEPQQELDLAVKRAEIQLRRHDLYAEGVGQQLVEEVSTSNVIKPRIDSIAPEEPDHVHIATQDLIRMNQVQSLLLGGDNVDLENPTYSSVSKSLQIEHVDDQDDLQDVRQKIRAGLAALPEPKNDFDIVLEGEEDEQEQIVAAAQAQDAGERDRLIAEQERLEHEKAMARRSQVLQRGLPRPSPDLVKSFSSDKSDVLTEIESEMWRLIVSDSIRFPVQGQGGLVVSTKSLEAVVPDLDDAVRDNIMAQIKAEVLEIPLEFSDDDLPCDEATEEDLNSRIHDLASQAAEAENKAHVLFGGYMRKSNTLSTRLAQSFENLVSNMSTYALAVEQDQVMTKALSDRVTKLQDEVNFLADAERAGQVRYRRLVEQRNAGS